MQLQEILYSQGFGTRRVCAGLVQQGHVTVAARPSSTDPCAEFEPRGPALHRAGRRVGIPREGLPDAAQAGRQRVLAEAVDLAQHLHAAAGAAAPAAEQGRRAGRAGDRPAGPGHHRPAAADRRRPVHPPHEFAQAPRAQGLRGRRPSIRSTTPRWRACWPAWCSTTTRSRCAPRPASRPATHAPAPDADRRQVPPGQAHAGGGGQPGRGPAPLAHRRLALPADLAPGQWRWLRRRSRSRPCRQRARAGQPRAGVDIVKIASLLPEPPPCASSCSPDWPPCGLFVCSAPLCRRCAGRAAADLRAEFAGRHGQRDRSGHLDRKAAHPDRQGAAPPVPDAGREVADRRQRAGRFADLHRPAHGRSPARGARHHRSRTTCASRPT